MDINSPEFYTLAFVVAMALVALLMGRREKRPPSTYIEQLHTAPDDPEAEDILYLEPAEGGKMLLRRTGITLGAEETANLVITIQEDNCSIVEKKGVRKRGVKGEPVKGEARLKCLRPGHKFRVRYESQLTSAWASFTLDTNKRDTLPIPLKY